MPRRILILYTELAGYLMACLRELSREGIEVHIVRRPINDEAPFAFEFWKELHVYDRREFDGRGLVELARRLEPAAILCAGWLDRAYLRVCKDRRAKCVNILTLDNHWHGTLRQQAARFLSRLTLLPMFHFAWVPGAPQRRYARKLGFRDTQIHDGFYAADAPFFLEHGQAALPSKRARFPHRFLYAGRYHEFKGAGDLWTAFASLGDRQPHDWELWCLGTGSLAPAEHPRIRHFGFVQPRDLPRFIADTGVFVMPSRVEPWGVALHEFAAASFPLVCSAGAGAATRFLEPGANGWLHAPGDVNSLRDALGAVIRMPDARLLEMGIRSAELGGSLTPQTWVATLLEILSSSTGHVRD